MDQDREAFSYFSPALYVLCCSCPRILADALPAVRGNPICRSHSALGVTKDFYFVLMVYFYAFVFKRQGRTLYGFDSGYLKRYVSFQYIHVLLSVAGGTFV